MVSLFGTAPKTIAVRRVAQLFVCDPEPSVPLDQCLIYSGLAKITESTDEELVAEIGSADKQTLDVLLERHNKKRIGWVNLAVKDHVQYLDKINREELKIVVHTLATF